MKAQIRKAIATVSTWLSLGATAATLHVDLNSPDPTPPYTNWATAATNIQAAIDAASEVDVVLVTNGVYQAGQKLIPGVPSPNRVAVDKAITVASVNGPEVTTIIGIVSGRVPIRCAYLADGAVLDGFTLANGRSGEQGIGAGGGAYCQSAAATLTNCTLTTNLSEIGGGAYQGTLLNCILAGNTARSGGGAYQATLINCFLSTNSAALAGSAGGGGGAYDCTLSNCTLTGNSSPASGGGALNSTLNNCIVYYNTAPSGSNYSGGSLNYCCTAPLPGSGQGNFSEDPQFSSTSHLSAASPCRGAGSAAHASGTDLDGEPWANPPSVGCDEYVSGSVTGPLSVSISAGYTNVAPGTVVGFTGTVVGKASASTWDFGDGVQATNLLHLSHAWTASGPYPVVLTAFSEDHPGGISATQIVQVADQTIFYVARDNANPVAPYTNWATAAQDIQSALDLAVLPGQWVLVSNGVYQTGGRLAGNTTNRVAVQRPTRLVSVNGPELTIIEGQRAAGGGIGAGAVRCVYLAAGAVLEGFTLRGGATESFDAGGGVCCASRAAMVTNCVLFNNYGAWGAGAFSGTFDNCTFENNSSYSDAGGAYQSTLNGCLLIGNAAEMGGGARASTLNNCRLERNRGVQYGGGAAHSTLTNCVLERNTADFGAGTYFGTATKCVYTNNYAYRNGGGIHSGTANNCLLIANHAGDALYTDTGGGAACQGTLNHCLIVGNGASWHGGGTFSSTVNNCVLNGNEALYGGGANGGALRNCTVAGNSGFFDGGGVMNSALYNSVVYFNRKAGNTNNYAGDNAFNYCCTTPDPGSGSGNITHDPAFADLAAGDLRLLSNSACINSGNNAFIPGGPDLDGSPRIAGGTVDLGPYEFQTPASAISYAWLQMYGLPPGESQDSADLDGDGHNNHQEWRADTVPTNAASALRIFSLTNSPAGLNLTWHSVATRSYFLERATNLVGAAAFRTVATNLAGAAGITTYLDPGAANSGPHFYRVGVQ